MFRIGFNRAMKRAWLLLTLYLLTQNIMRFIRASEATEMKIALFIQAIAWPFILVYVIALVRTQIGDSVQSAMNRGEITTWGWFWRSFVLLFAQGLILLAFGKLLGLCINLQRLSPVEMILWLAPFSLTSTVGAWLMYSLDRSNQLRLVLAAFSSR